MDICRIEAAAMRMSIQDSGRAGWARYGVPTSGTMDDHAAEWANRLLENPLNAPVLEIPGSGARLRFLCDAWIAVTGAKGKYPMWRAVHAQAGDLLEIGELEAGLWTYIAVKGGFASALWLGSASAYPRAGFGELRRVGDVLRAQKAEFVLPVGVSARIAPWTEQRDYSRPPALRVWRGPQWSWFSDAQRNRFFVQAWTVSSQSDRVGYRLSGEALTQQIGKPSQGSEMPPPHVGGYKELISEPVIPGTIQVPENGQPIVTMRDGPTVGGYAKLGVVDERDISWLTQVRPGRDVRFQLVDEI